MGVSLEHFILSRLCRLSGHGRLSLPAKVREDQYFRRRQNNFNGKYVVRRSLLDRRGVASEALEVIVRQEVV